MTCGGPAVCRGLGCSTATDPMLAGSERVWEPIGFRDELSVSRDALL